MIDCFWKYVIYKRYIRNNIGVFHNNDQSKSQLFVMTNQSISDDEFS